jgi:hypothetical protein
MSFVPTLPLRTSFVCAIQICSIFGKSHPIWHPEQRLSNAPRPSLSFNAMHASRLAFSESQIEGHPSALAPFKHFIHCACSWGHRAAPRNFNTLFSSALQSCHLSSLLFFAFCTLLLHCSSWAMRWLHETWERGLR